MENTSVEVTAKPQERIDSAQPVSASKPKRFLPLLNFVLLLVLLGAVAWDWHEIKLSQQHLILTETHISKLFTQQTQVQQNANNQITYLTHQFQQQQTQVSQMNSQLEQLNQRSSGDLKSWKINEIVYLVQIANLQLSVHHSVPLALQLLKQADQQLTVLADPALEGFHQAILKNIATLQNIPPMDPAAVIMQLSALRDQVPNLSILVSPKPNTSVLLDTQHQDQKKWWQRAWDNIKASMQALVIVRHQDQTLPAVMSPDQQVYLQENLQLLLIQAQWAVMNHQSVVYQNSIKQAKSWVAKFYVQNSASTQDFLKQLQNLEMFNIAPTLPDLTNTLALVSQE